MKGAPPAFLPDDGFRYPVQPTYDVNVQFDQSDVITALFLAQSNAAWYEVGECPNEKGIASFRKTLVHYAEAQKRASELAASLKDPLRSEFKRAASTGAV